MSIVQRTATHCNAQLNFPSRNALCILAKKPYISATELCIFAKEPYISAKEPFLALVPGTIRN